MHKISSVRIRTTPPEVFKSIAEMIRASSIMTPRHEFGYCKPKDLLGKKLRMMQDRYFDVIPMLRGKNLETGRIFGYLDQGIMKQKMEEGYKYCEDAEKEIENDDLLKNDLPMEDVMFRFASRTNEPKVPFFVVNSPKRILGLITLADLDKTAMKMYLFALISELELSLLEIVSERYDELRTVCTCKYCLRCRKRRGKKCVNDNLDEYYYLYIRELMHIIINSNIKNQIEKRTKKILREKDCRDISQLRNTIVHPKPLVSGKFPINRLIKVHSLVKDLIVACKT